MITESLLEDRLKTNAKIEINDKTAIASDIARKQTRPDLLG